MTMGMNKPHRWVGYMGQHGYPKKPSRVWQAINVLLWLALLIGCLAAGYEWALDDAEAHDFWISHGAYTDPMHPTVHCCGSGDCKELDALDVSSTPAGYLIRSLGETVPYSEAYPSEDGKLWRCQRWDGTRRCFFSPMPGS